MRNRRIELSSMMCIDAACAALALFIAAVIWHGDEGNRPLVTFYRIIPLLFVTTLVWLLVSDRLLLNHCYRFRSELVSRVIVGMAVLGIGVAPLSFVVGKPFRTMMLIGFLVLFFLAVVAVRLAVRAITYRSGSVRKGRRAVILGNGYMAREIARVLEQDPAFRCEVIGYLSPEGQEPALGRTSGVAQDTIATGSVCEYLANKKVDQLFLVLPNSGDPTVLKLVAECRNAGVEVAFVPHAYELYISRTVLRKVGGIPLIATDQRRLPAHSAFFKRVTDWCMATVLLLAVAPLIALTAAVLLVKGRRPFRSEVRCGQGGRQFSMYRFNVNRSAVRLNAFDSILQTTSISELPQLWNVLRGDMSMVGPRPEPPERVAHYWEWLNQRLVYKPGITGLAQVRGLRERHSSGDKARLDLQYPLSWSPLLDLTLIVQTLWIIADRVRVSSGWRAADVRPSPGALTELDIANANSSQSGAD